MTLLRAIDHSNPYHYDRHPREWHVWESGRQGGFHEGQHGTAMGEDSFTTWARRLRDRMPAQNVS